MKTNLLSLTKAKALLLLCILWQVSMSAAFAQSGSRTVTGKVIDDTNEPLIGVNVLIVGTTVGTITDFDGNFSLTVPEGAKELQFSYIGYTSQTVAITGKVLNVQLKPDSQMLSDVVVIGYGTQRKSDLTGAVTNVSSDDFNTGLVSSPEQLINGKISGVQIMSNSGSPTAGSTIRVRGGASLNASNDPLIVLDGVPLEQGGISGNSGNFLSLINPNDIESMTILKDASSTAIYGSRASNGVIIITTNPTSCRCHSARRIPSRPARNWQTCSAMTSLSMWCAHKALRRSRLCWEPLTRTGTTRFITMHTERTTT